MRSRFAYAGILVFVCCAVVLAGERNEKTFVNSIGMKLVRVEAGTFLMGFGNGPLAEELTRAKGHFPSGDWDEHPAHEVTITRAFYIGAYEVTNAQYEQFDPEAKKRRGKNNRSFGDNEAVVYVNWNEASRFCEWLSKKEGRPYRLPTEAEWENACRAGTTTNYHTGDILPEEFSKRADMVALEVSRTVHNAWGLYDTHGNVEEWVYDWYGPYQKGLQVDPLGRESGNVKVTRGGSYAFHPYYMRSSNRSGTIPQDRLSMTGFRVVLGELPKSKPLPRPGPPLAQQNVSQKIPPDVTSGPDPNKPYFKKPAVFVKIPEGSTGPLFSRHNHNTAIAECDNGDFLATWFSCMEEKSRENCIAGTRLRYGQEQWEPASVFWDVPDRDEPAHSLWKDGKGTIYHFNGLGCMSDGHDPGLILRTSTDNGATWSAARPISAAHNRGCNAVLQSIFRAREGEIVVSFDGFGGAYTLISKDDGRSWVNPGGRIRGIHAGIVQLEDGRLMALARRGSINGKMPKSISSDMGKSWTYSAGEFQPLGLGQRLVLIRLKEGPLFLASFCRKMMVTDASGRQRPISGLFGAVSFDDAATWPCRRLISDDGPGRWIETMDGHLISMSAYSGEFVGYLSVCQSANRVIHLLSSREHYAFNLKWLMTPPPAVAAAPAPRAQQLATKANLSSVYRAKGPPTKDNRGWRFRNDALSEDKVVSLSPEGLLEIQTGKGQCWWRSERPDFFGAVDAKKGFTAEIRTQVLKASSNERGLDLELYDGLGSRYAITITETGVYWYEGLLMGSGFLKFEEYTAVAEGLDNTSRMHSYRLAVRAGRIVQIYRDGKLLGVRRFEYRTPRDAYICFGAGRRVQALVDYISFDLGGPFGPGDKKDRRCEK